MLNSQCSILIRSGCSIAKTCGRFSFRMRIEHWELNIGQILPSPHSAQVIFALALSFTPQVSSTPPLFSLQRGECGGHIQTCRTRPRPDFTLLAELWLLCFHQDSTERREFISERRRSS